MSLPSAFGKSPKFAVQVQKQALRACIRPCVRQQRIDQLKTAPQLPCHRARVTAKPVATTCCTVAFGGRVHNRGSEDAPESERANLGCIPH